MSMCCILRCIHKNFEQMKNILKHTLVYEQNMHRCAAHEWANSYPGIKSDESSKIFLLNIWGLKLLTNRQKLSEKDSLRISIIYISRNDRYFLRSTYLVNNFGPVSTIFGHNEAYLKKSFQHIFIRIYWLLLNSYIGN